MGEEKEKAKKEEEKRKQQTIKYEEMDVKDVENSNDYATISKIFKAKGNQHYLKKDYISAILYYTEALEHRSKECQFKTEAEEEGEDKFYDYIKDSEDEEDDSENEDLEEKPKEEKGKACTENDKLNVNQEDVKEIKQENAPAPEIIYPSVEEAAVYYCNRAACNLALGKFRDVISDCTFSLRLKEDYLKAYMRRAQAFEKLDQMEDALKDYEKIVELDPHNIDARKKGMYLTKVVAERQEKLKEETLGKLKDLGNSLLGHVGLSLDNFKMEKNEGGS